ncbi:MAG: 16S rRNA processing protein RimM [Magnetospirillum sp. 64-120]|nr:MAG: 16S rRNA processing protein RimM [Magnetospirillum sp. 64-120]
MGARVCIGAIVGAHGIRGAVRVKSFTADPLDVAAYGPAEDEAGKRRFKLKVMGEVKDHVLASIEGVTDRNAAEALKGTGLYVSRDLLPPTEEDEFLYSDLVGLKAVGTDGSVIGTVKGVANFGAGDLLDVARPGQGSLLVPFTKAAVPVVDVGKGQVVVDPPAYAEDEEGEETRESGDQRPRKKNKGGQDAG